MTFKIRAIFVEDELMVKEVQARNLTELTLICSKILELGSVVSDTILVDVEEITNKGYK